MTPPKNPCDIKTKVDRYNKPLLCPKGVSYRQDILIKPYTNCPPFWSYRCSKCSCGAAHQIVCRSPFIRYVVRWHIIGQCCVPEFSCGRSGQIGAPRPISCKLSACSWDNPEGVWELISSIPPQQCIRWPCPGCPNCNIPYNPIYVPNPYNPDSGPCGLNGWGYRCGVMVMSEPECRGKTIGVRTNTGCSPIYPIK